MHCRLALLGVGTHFVVDWCNKMGQILAKISRRKKRDERPPIKVDDPPKSYLHSFPMPESNPHSLCSVLSIS